MAYALRLFEDDDAPSLTALTIDAIKRIGAEAYSPEQVRVWSSGHFSPERFIERAKTGHHIYILVDPIDAPAAYALLEPDGHLDMLYCSPKHARRGLAQRLLTHAEGEARALGLEALYTEASELARPVFEQAGYALQRRREFELGGVTIHNYAMEKPLI